MKFTYGQFTQFFINLWVFAILNYCGYICLFRQDLIDLQNGNHKGMHFVMGGMLSLMFNGYWILWAIIEIQCMDFWNKKIDLDKLKNDKK